MNIDPSVWQVPITVAAVIGAFVAIMKYYNKVYELVRHQKEQDKFIKDTREELALLTDGILACLKGLHEQGANGPVTAAIGKIEAHINQRAHEV
jgi:hypothetical protein